MIEEACLMSAPPAPVALVLIPYITAEDDAAEVWIKTYPWDVDDLTLARTALEDFADETAPDLLASHLELWRVDRMLLPDRTAPYRWRAVQALEVLEGRLTDVV
jgi:hypothetical protein